MAGTKKTGDLIRYSFFSLILVCLVLLLYRSLYSPFGSPQAAAGQGQQDPAGSPQDQLIYHNNIGIALLEQFSFREAIAEFEKCLKIDARFVPALVNTALGHFYLQEFPKAQEFLLSALSLEPS